MLRLFLGDVLKSRIYLQVSYVQIDVVEAVLDVVELVDAVKVDGAVDAVIVDGGVLL